jgi:hypothetical protein
MYLTKSSSIKRKDKIGENQKYFLSQTIVERMHNEPKSLVLSRHTQKEGGGGSLLIHPLKFFQKLFFNAIKHENRNPLDFLTPQVPPRNLKGPLPRV